MKSDTLMDRLESTDARIIALDEYRQQQMMKRGRFVPETHEEKELVRFNAWLRDQARRAGLLPQMEVV